jgi:hypothetical protein
MIEQTKIYGMLEIFKNCECNIKVRNLGFGHKLSAHASGKHNVMTSMSNMKKLPNNTTVVCSVNNKNATSVLTSKPDSMGTRQGMQPSRLRSNKHFRLYQ